MEEVRVGGSVSITQSWEDQAVQDLRNHVRTLNLTQKATSLKEERAKCFRKIISQREENGLGILSGVKKKRQMITEDHAPLASRVPTGPDSHLQRHGT